MAQDELVKLKAKQLAFVEHYLVSGNATDAAIKAGYPAKSARSKGCQLLTNVNVKAALEKRRRQKAERIEIDQDRVLEEATAILIANITDVLIIGETGIDMKNPEDIPLHAKKAIKKITFTNERTENDRGEKTTTRISVEMHDKVKMIEFFRTFLDMKADPNANGNNGDAAAKSERVLAAIRKVAGGGG
jgi:phage terminase small subunit